MSLQALQGEPKTTLQMLQRGDTAHEGAGSSCA